MRLRVLKFLLVLPAALSVASSARADFIQPNTAVASTEFISGFDGRAINTINGTGLPVGFGVGSSHADYASGNHWTTAGGTVPSTQFITFGFTTVQTLDAIHIWNHRSTTPPANNTGYDVTLFDLTLFGQANDVLLVLNDVALAPDTANSQTFSFGGAIAGISSVRFDVEGVQSSTTFTGLAEVGFNTASVTAAPEPGTLALVGMAVLPLAGAAVRRRKA